MNRNHGRVRCQNRRGGTGLDQLGEYVLFEFEPFRSGFGYVVRLLDRLGEIAGDGDAFSRLLIETIGS